MFSYLFSADEKNHIKQTFLIISLLLPVDVFVADKRNADILEHTKHKKAFKKIHISSARNVIN